MLVTELEVALEVGRHFDELGVVWLIGGSIASSLLGEPRATYDVDLVADLRMPHVSPLCARLLETHYIEETTVRWAVSTRRTFNAIHLVSMMKVDVYCSKHDALSRGQIERRVFFDVGTRRVPLCSPEDIILQKLLWFVEGGGVSDRQWRDLLGVAKVHRGKLDRDYLELHASENALSELLARLLAGAEPV